jgi:raffinose/stachyose/melibiose transport system permease protein
VPGSVQPPDRMATISRPGSRPDRLSVPVFMYTWNDFLLALVMNPSGRVFTAPLALSFFAGSQRTTDQTVVAAAAVLVALPVIIFYILLQRQFVRGFLTGAVKE